MAPDGTIAYVSMDINDYATGVSRGEIGILPPGGSPRPFVTREGSTTNPTFSPDGRWLAYVSDANGSDNVYIRPYPGPGTPTLVTNMSGQARAEAPAWSRDGRRLYYKAVAPPPVFGVRLMVVDVSNGGELRVGTPRSVMGVDNVSGPVRGYDVFPDGSIVARVGGLTQLPGVRELHVVLNFAEELRARLP